MKLKPIFNSNPRREVIQKLSPAAEYARELYQGGYKMLEALRRASRSYGEDIHSIASQLGIRGGKSKKRRVRKEYGPEN